jgi:putative DNA primase/helicase
VVPVLHGDWLVSVQTIGLNGEKRFWPGAPVKAGCFVLDRPRAAVTTIVEGLATGLAVFQGLRQARVIVAFDAGNLLPVVQRIKPTGSVCIAADNDHGTQTKRGVNPGLEKARNAAELIGCGVAYPTGIEGSDWADFLKQVGEGAARKMERLILGQCRYIEAPA